MRQKIIGIFSLGFEDCELVLREGTGGEFYNCPGKGEIPRVKIGADVKEWRDLVAVLLHEAMEFALNRLRCRYSCSYDFGNDAGGYIFVLDHPQFSDCCARAAEFLALSLPVLAKEWPKFQRVKPEGKP